MKTVLKKNIYSLLILSVAWFAVTSCDTYEPDPRQEEESFTKIYDNSQFSFSITPLDIKQTADKGYLVLADRKLDNTDYAGIYLMKADEKGNFVKDIEVEETYVHPVIQLMEDQESFYFFCMNQETLGTVLVKIDAGLESIEFIDVPNIYPLAADKDNTPGNFVLLNYDHENRKSVLSKVNTAGAILDDVGVDIGLGDNDAIDEAIILHFRRTSRHLPFQAGHIPSGPYFFNGFEDYTFSLVFTTFNDDNPVSGAVNGQEDNGGFSTIMPISSSKFAMAWFNFNENFLVPNASVNTSDKDANVISMGGYTLPELVPYANVKILRTVVDGTNTLIYGSDTKAKQIGLYFYDEASGNFIGSKYLGFSNPFEISSMVATEDEGIAVCGTTYIAGRFPRICIFKLAKEELANSIQKE